MLTFRCAGMILASAAFGAAAFVSAATLASIAASNPARADGMAVGGCIGSRFSFNCAMRWGAPTDPYARLVTPPVSEDEKKRAAERDHQWQERCRPTVVQDRYGVPRYLYVAPRCEFGVIN